MNKEEFGLFLRSKRESEGLSQDALATMVGSQQQILGNWESGRALPTGDAADKICDFLGFDRDELEKIRRDSRKVRRTNVTGQNYNVQTGQNVMTQSGSDLSPSEQYLIRLVRRHGGEELIDELIALIINKDK